jgi:hypothetical protein
VVPFIMWNDMNMGSFSGGGMSGNLQSSAGGFVFYGMQYVFIGTGYAQFPNVQSGNVVNNDPGETANNENGTPNPHIVPGTQCNTGCHKEPFTPHWDKQHTCPQLWLLGGASLAVVPGAQVIDLAGQWFLYGLGAGSFIGGGACL